MKRLAFILLSLAAILTGCATVKPGNQSAVVRSEQTLSIALAAVDSFLAFESKRRADVPASVQDVAARIRGKAPAAFESANRLRLAYKSNRIAGNEADLMAALAVVEAIVGEVRVWVPATSAGVATSPVAALVREAEANRVETAGSWALLIPVFVDLAKEIYITVNRAREASKQDAEWGLEQEADFAARLSATRSATHWKP